MASLSADELIDRRRIRRKLTFWRAATIIILIISLFVLVRWMLGDRVAATPHIAQIRIEGTITEDERLLDRLEDIRRSKDVRGVIVTVDSPGGTTAGGEAIYEEIRLIAQEKPVVAQVGTLAASAGYMIASAADHIVARQSSIVGSIGVLVQLPNLTGLMEKLGIGVEEVKSSPLKAEPSPFNETTDEERAMMRAMIMDSYDWFVDLVTERRPLSREEVLTLADGSVFTGRQAAQAKLVDALGGEREAKQWLVEKGLDENLQVVEWKPRSDDVSLFMPEIASRWLARVLGYSTEEQLIRALGAERIFLDGLVSVWQPDASRALD